MRYVRLIVMALLLSSTFGGTLFSQQSFWVTAYYPGYARNYLRADSIDFSAITHLIHFALAPTDTGGLNQDTNGIRQDSTLRAKAQSHGIKVLICVGGANTGQTFRRIMGIDSVARNFENRIAAYVVNHGYIGADIDWESPSSADTGYFNSLIRNLRDRLPRPQYLLTVTPTSDMVGDNTIAAALASLQPYVDQINLQTYNLAGPYQGWMTWHNAPIYDGGAKFPNTQRPMPSAHQMVTQLHNAGVALGKMSIGIDYYGWVWHEGTVDSTGGGPTDPRQTWSVAPNYSADVPYYRIKENIAKSSNARLKWDFNPYNDTNGVKAAYYQIVNTNNAALDSFVTFDNQISCYWKVKYARRPGIADTTQLRGVMIWDLSGGYDSTLAGTSALPDSLLKTIKAAVFGVPAPAIVYPAVNATGVSVNPPQLTWRASLGSTVYQVDFHADTIPPGGSGRWSGEGLFWDDLLTDTTRTWTLSPDSFVNASSYTWSVIAMPRLDTPRVDGMPVGGTTTSHFTTESFTTPPIPTLLAPQNTASNTSLHPVLSWQSFSFTSHFTVQVATDTGFSNVVVEDLTPTGATFDSLTEPLSYTTLYYWRIYASNNTGRSSPWSSRWTFTTGDPPPPPSAPTLSSPGNGVTGVALSPTLTWSSCTGATVYHIQIATDQAFSNLVHNIARTTNSTSVGTLNANTLYYWHVNAGNDGGNSDWSGTWHFTTGSAPPPGPCGLSIPAFGTLDNFIVNDHQGYSANMLVNGVNLPMDEEVQKYNVNIPDQPKGVFHVRFASNRFIESVVKGKTAKHLPIQVKNAAFPITFRWNLHQHQNHLKYVLNIPSMKNGVPGKSIQLHDTGSVSISSNGSGSGNIVLTLDAEPDQTGPPCGGESKAAVRHSEESANIRKGIPLSFMLHQNYPNPFNPTTMINYDLPKDAFVTLRVYNTLGEVVHTLVESQQLAGFKSVSLDMRGLGSGVYFYSVRAGSFSSVKKFVLMK